MSESSTTPVKNAAGHLVLTQSQADAAQVEYDRLIAEYEASMVGKERSAMEYYTIKALWARAYGGDVIQVVPDPRPEAEAPEEPQAENS